MRDDREFVTVENISNHDVGFTLTTSQMHRSLIPGVHLEMTKGEVRELNYEPGGHYMLMNLLRVTDRNLAKEIGVDDDYVEYWWDDDDIDKVLNDPKSLPELEDALEFGPEGIVDRIVAKAVEENLADNDKVEAISRITGRDVRAMVQNLHAYDAMRPKADDASPKRRRKTFKRRKAVTSDA